MDGTVIGIVSRDLLRIRQDDGMIVEAEPGDTLRTHLWEGGTYYKEDPDWAPVPECALGLRVNVFADSDGDIDCYFDFDPRTARMAINQRPVREYGSATGFVGGTFYPSAVDRRFFQILNGRMVPSNGYEITRIYEQAVAEVLAEQEKRAVTWDDVREAVSDMVLQKVNSLRDLSVRSDNT